MNNAATTPRPAVIDTTDVIGGGKYVWLHQGEIGGTCRAGAGDMIGHLIGARGSDVVYVLDHAQRLAGWITPESVRECIAADLQEAQALAWESEMSDACRRESVAIGAALERVATARITVDSITSPRTGRKGWRVVYREG